MVRSSDMSPDDHEESENRTDANVQIPLDNIRRTEGNVRHEYQSNDLEGAVGYSRPIPDVDVNNMRDHEDSEINYHRRHSSAEMYGHSRPQHMHRHSESMEFRRNARAQDDERIQDRDYVPSETAVIGLELYIDVLPEEVRRRILQDPECLVSQFAINSHSRNENIKNIIDRFHYIAKEFADTPLRQEVKQKADSVLLQDLDFQSFSDLLFGLFQEGGVTSERIVVLFFFCSDLAVRALCDSVTGKFSSIIKWSQQYIIQKLSIWIQQNGGWAAVLQHSMNRDYKLAMIGLGCIAAVAVLMFMRRNLK